MLLYHGSNTEIFNVELEKCRPFKDFGKGFYLTTIEEQAVNMAIRTTKFFTGIPHVTTFEFNAEVLDSGKLSVKVFDIPTAEWAMFVLNNRDHDYTEFANENCNHDNKYDVVTGPVANDDIALLFSTFSRGYIDMDYLVKNLKYKKLTNQYSFHTERAVSFLKKTGAKAYG